MALNIDESKYYLVSKEATQDFRKRWLDEFKKKSQGHIDYEFFKHVIVNPRVLLNMMKHSLTTSNEIAGIIAGHFDEKQRVFLLTDSYMYPVEGTGSSVEVPSTIQYITIKRLEFLHQLGRLEDSVGWYHSHPNLHCFYSNTDVKNHTFTYRASNGTAVGLVIDPINTMVSGHLNLGAYNITDPEKAKNAPPPTTAQIKKYGTAANNYYSLDIHYICSELDKVVLNDFISKSYGIALQSSPLAESSKFLVDSMDKSKQNIKADEDRDPLELRDKISSLNSERVTGLWIHRKKRSIFG